MSSDKKVLPDLEQALGALKRDFKKLEPRIRKLDHSVKCECEGVSLRVCFTSFRQGEATIHDLVEALNLYLIPFALPQSELDKLYDAYGKIDAEEFSNRHTVLRDKATDLFKRAHKTTNRNGEAGELLLYALTGWILDAPQVIAKMSLKTNAQMPVHGADGVHVKFCKKTSTLTFYWGESKIYSKVSSAIAAAVKSIGEALDPAKVKHELDLVERNIDFAGLNDDQKTALLRYLDPFDEASNNRHQVITCLIGYDAEAYSKITATDGDEAEKRFSDLAVEALKQHGKDFATALKAAGLENREIELFFFPVPSVKKFRDTFQAKIGWSQ